MTTVDLVDPWSTAWLNGVFNVDTANVIARSDIVLGHPNLDPAQAMPLGNGDVGVAVWAASGLTAQLNRVDSMPDGKSPGTLTLPGLMALTAAADYSGRLRLFDAIFSQSGGGLHVDAYVRHDADELVIDVSGADPAVMQTAVVAVPSTRASVATAGGSIATLSETWTDEGESKDGVHFYGGSGATFGVLAALTVGGRNVTASVTDTHTIQIAFLPNADGTFRVVVRSPNWKGGDAGTAAQTLFGNDATATGLSTSHLAWWHQFWQMTGKLKLGSVDGQAEYFENLRALNLYTSAASSGTTNLPGARGGQAHLFASRGDQFDWCLHCFWNWNLRMGVAANLGAGAFASNGPYFGLYRSNLDAMRQWTQTQMNGRPGICVPETVRFNGNGYTPFFDTSSTTEPNATCSANGNASWNARNISTGAEVGLWIWRQYQYTQDRAFLVANYPVMADAARFLLSYATLGSDGHLHTSPSNAHESQWDVSDPTTDISAMKSLWPAVIAAAQLLGTDPDLIAQLQTALGQVPPYRHTLAKGVDVFAFSNVDGQIRNDQNISLEPLWPYDVIGDGSGADFDTARRTYTSRPNVLPHDWAADPIQAARLKLADEVAQTLVAGTEVFQVYVNGFATLSPGWPEFYAEWGGVVTTALQEALVQAYDGTVRIAPAWPSQWEADGTVFIAGGHRIDVQFHGGAPTTVAVEAGSTANLPVVSPWPGVVVEVVDSANATVVPGTSSSPLLIPVAAGKGYLIRRVGDSPQYAPIAGSAAQSARSLGTQSIGL